MKVRCRSFAWDGLDKTRWNDYPYSNDKDHPQDNHGRADGPLYNAVCSFVSSLPEGSVISIAQDTPYGTTHVFVYYYEKEMA